MLFRKIQELSSPSKGLFRPPLFSIQNGGKLELRFFHSNVRFTVQLVAAMLPLDTHLPKAMRSRKDKGGLWQIIEEKAHSPPVTSIHFE